ncbi:MAG: hypothetical protein K8R21_02170 [Leptospira sp.]|nr:hypothetical protein [Leptospira sp.]
MKITKIGIFAVLFMATITLFAGPSDKMKEALEKGDKSFFAKVKWKSFEAANNTDPKTTFIASSCYQKEEKCAEALIGVLSNSDGQVRASVFGELQYNFLEGLR